MKNLKKILDFNFIQVVPIIFIASLVFHSVTAYTQPKNHEMEIGNRQVKANTTEKKKETQTIGDIDLSKIKDGTYNGSGTGFRGKIYVAVTVKSHEITNVDVTKSSDDTAYVTKAKQLIQNVVSKQSIEVDTVSGATYSSKGIIAAIKNALTGEEDTSSAAGNSNTTNSNGKKVLPKENETGTYKDGVYKGTGTGFRGKITVQVTIKKQKIKKISILKNERDDASYFEKATGVISKMIKKQSTNVDVVTGATYSSNGIIEATREALDKARVKKTNQTSATTENSTDTTEETVTETTDNEPTKDENGTVISGTFSGVVTCNPDKDWDFDPYTLSLEVVYKDGKISAIQNVKGAKLGNYFYYTLNDDYITKAKTTMIPKLLLGETPDAVSGATCSSKAILEAYQQAVKKAQ